MDRTRSPWKTRGLLLLAVGLVILGMILPFGFVLTYPARLFNTFIHETGHAVMAVLTGGEVVELRVNLDTSGQVLSRGSGRILTSSAGYLSTTLTGAALLLAGRRRSWARPALIALGAATLLSTVLFASSLSILAVAVGAGVGLALIGLAVGRARNKQAVLAAVLGIIGGLLVLAALGGLALTGAMVTWAVGLGVGALLLATAVAASPVVRHFAVLLLGVQVSLDGLRSVRGLIALTSNGVGHSDAVNMANYTGVPAIVWAVLWGAVGLVVVGAALLMFWRDPGEPVLARRPG